jgi:hypothetical protein
VKYAKEGDEGIMKQVSEAFLVDAVSYTDAESRIFEAMERDINGEFQVTRITKTNLEDVINHEGEMDYWYKCKITYSSVDGDSDKEVKVNTYHLVSAENVHQAYERTRENLNGMLVPFEIPSIVKTNVTEVYPYSADEIPSNLKSIDELHDDVNS